MILFVEFDADGIGKVITVLEETGTEEAADFATVGEVPASSSLKLEPGGMILPLLIMNKWDAEKEEWEDDLWNNGEIIIPEGGMDKVYIETNEGLPSDYILEISTWDFFGNESEVVEFNVEVMDEPDGFDPDAEGVTWVSALKYLGETIAADPTLEAFEAATLESGDTLEIQAKAQNPEGDNSVLKYELRNAPKGMTISSGGLINWDVPDDATSGVYAVQVIVLGQGAAKVSGTLKVTVEGGDDPEAKPVFDPVAPQVVKVGESVEFEVSAKVPEDEEIEVEIVAKGLPSGATFDPDEGFEWEPADDQVGDHVITFIATEEEGGKAELLVTITVSANVIDETPPAISIVRNDNGTITVTFQGSLQLAPTVNGPWKNVGAASPLKLTPDQAVQFGRAVR